MTADHQRINQDSGNTEWYTPDFITIKVAY